MIPEEKQNKIKVHFNLYPNLVNSILLFNSDYTLQQKSKMQISTRILSFLLELFHAANQSNHATKTTMYQRITMMPEEKQNKIKVHFNLYPEFSQFNFIIQF